MHSLSSTLQGYLAHTKSPTLSTLHNVHVQGPMVVLGGVAVSCKRGTPVNRKARHARKARVRMQAPW